MNKEENIHYDAWLIWKINEICNMRCVYCSSDLGKDSYAHKKLSSTIKSKIKSLFRIGLPSAVRITWSRINRKPRAINIKALGRSLSNTRKIYKISLSGGEPFLTPDIIGICAEITRKHFVGFSTNLTSDKIKDFAETIDPNRVIQIIASCHIKELERLGLLDRYIRNFHLCKEKGFNILAVEVAYPPLLREAEKYREFFRKNEIVLFFDRFCGRYKGRLYPESYIDEEIRGFDLENRPNIGMFHSKGKLCNAGYNAGVVDSDGNMCLCFGINESLGNIYSDIEFKKSMVHCPCEHCGCPINCYDTDLFEKAMAERMVG